MNYCPKGTQLDLLEMLITMSGKKLKYHWLIFILMQRIVCQRIRILQSLYDYLPFDALIYCHYFLSALCNICCLSNR